MREEKQADVVCLHKKTERRGDLLKKKTTLKEKDNCCCNGTRRGRRDIRFQKKGGRKAGALMRGDHLSRGMGVRPRYYQSPTKEGTGTEERYHSAVQHSSGERRTYFEGAEYLRGQMLPPPLGEDLKGNKGGWVHKNHDLSKKAGKKLEPEGGKKKRPNAWALLRGETRRNKRTWRVLRT